MRGQRATWEVKAARKRRTFWNERVSGVRGRKLEEKVSLEPESSH